MNNPYTPKQERAETRLAKLKAEQKRLNDNAIPGTFVTGRSGVSKAYRKKLDRQLDRTIDLAVKIHEVQGDVARFKQQESLYEQGKINHQGRSISPKQKKKSCPQSERIRTIRQALQELSLDGEYSLPTGHILSVWAQWNESERELMGLIRVEKDGVAADYRAESIQGVHLEKLEIEVIGLCFDGKSV